MRRLPENERYYVHEVTERLPEWRIGNLRPDQEIFQVNNEVRRQQNAVPKEWTYRNWDFLNWNYDSDKVQHPTIVWNRDINAPRNMIHILKSMLNGIEKHPILQRGDNNDHD